MIYVCCDRQRRNAVDAHPTLNGIDYLEVLDQDAPPGSPRQQTLLVRFLKKIPDWSRQKVEITGGDRRPVRDLWAVRADLAAAPPASAAEVAYFAGLDEPDHVLVVRTDSPGDYSVYTLELQTSEVDDAVPAGFDPRLAAVDFSFKVECPTDFDCREDVRCPEPLARTPPIDYLAKDYSSFRRLMLDRLATLVPAWQERNPADAGIALVELLAYVGDHLSYRQDAIATEAYLGTARRRISVRRHARLVDYFVGDGRSARTWVRFEVDADVRKAAPGDPPALPKGTRLLTRIDQQPVSVPDEERVINRAGAVFETLEPLEELYAAHQEMPFYTWSDEECCLPRGATAATLEGTFADLRPGEVLIFEEVLGPRTGEPADADPRHRHAVRLESVTTTDDVGDPLEDPVTGEAITEITWHPSDALPFPLCLSSRTEPRHGGVVVGAVSVAFGNVALAAHGRKVEETLGEVPRPHLVVPPPRGDRCDRQDPEPVPPRFRPVLSHGPVSQRSPWVEGAPAAESVPGSADGVLPEITLLGDGDVWSPRQDLLASDDDRPDFVLEVESDGGAVVRFGDDVNGRRPNAGTAFEATYRVGNGSAGNLGAGSLVHLVGGPPEIEAVVQPLPARGGKDPETVEEVRQRAPFAFRTQERAVTPADYAEVGGRHGEVQKAAATFRWTGSWHTVFLTVDRLCGLDVDEAFEGELRAQVERFRMAGHDLEVDGPRWVPLEVEIEVCVEPDHFRGEVRQELLRVLSDEDLPDDRHGVFHPDRLTFGQPVYLSRVYEAAQKVAGVASLHVRTFQRLDDDASSAVDDGVLEIGRLEIARLANDRNFPERGVLRLVMEGGR